jgi:hypothetical protein
MPLIFTRSADNLPLIGKFDDPPRLERGAPPLHMGSEAEEQLDEPEEPDDVDRKDSEFWKRKRQRRRMVRQRSLLVIEDEARRGPDPRRGLRFEGRLTNLNLSDSSQALAPFTNRPQARSVTEAPFKFVLLQPQQTATGTRVLVTPVGGPPLPHYLYFT